MCLMRTHYAVGMAIHGDRRTHNQRRYNSPKTYEIGVVFKSTDGAPPANRDVCARLLIPTNRGNAFIKIKSTQPMCDPMTYPLLFQTEIMDGFFLCLTRRQHGNG